MKEPFIRYKKFRRSFFCFIKFTHLIDRQADRRTKISWIIPPEQYAVQYNLQIQRLENTKTRQTDSEADRQTDMLTQDYSSGKYKQVARLS